MILLDTAPFLATNDASGLLPQTDLALLVVRSGRTTRESAHRCAEVLQRFSAPVLGVVFNGSDEDRGAQYYDYYGYTYDGSHAASASSSGSNGNGATTSNGNGAHAAPTVTNGAAAHATSTMTPGAPVHVAPTQTDGAAGVHYAPGSTPPLSN